MAYIKAPEHFPKILKAFGPQSQPDLERAVIAIKKIFLDYLSERQRKPPMKFDEATCLLRSKKSA